MSDLEEKLGNALRKAIEKHDQLNEQEPEDEDGGVSLEDYPEIPFDQLPEDVQQALRTWEEEAPDKDDRPLLWWLLGGEEGGIGTPPYKMTKELSNYGEAANPAQSCATCEFLYMKVTSGEYICSQISGEVHPQGWCKLWQKADVYEEDIPEDER
jgi:hypothetical protein